MMNKKYLMNGFAALALVATVSSCVKDVDGVSATEQEAAGKENAELQLGLQIPEGQTWDMAAQTTAIVTVNGDYGVNYVVNIYEQNPFTNGNQATILGRSNVKSGDTTEFQFTCPNYLKTVFAAIKDEKGYTYVKPAIVENGEVKVLFGDATASSRVLRAASATNSHVDIPTCTITNEYVQSFLTDAVEPTDANVVDNYDNSRYETNYGEGGANSIDWSDSNQVKDRNYFFGDDGNTDSWETRLAWALQNHPNWINVVKDETYVTKFKITSTWNKLIGVLATEEADGDARTVYVSGKWTIPAGEEQRVGGGAVIVIVEGGEIEIPAGSQLNFVNQARLVNAGGTISGAGTINVTNGNAAGEEGYNSGTISVGKFNQNFGTFFNYGTFADYATELNGGAGTSTFVNRGHMYIKGAPKGSNSANMQIKNNCWFEASGEVAGKLIENGAGAYFKAGALDLSSSEGGEGIGTYIAADASSKMLITGAVKLNSTLIYGPASGDEAYLEFDNINFLNVGETYPITGKLNIYVGSFTGANPSGYETSWNTNMAAGSGAQMVGKAAFNTAATDDSDCAPGFTPATPTPVYDEPIVYTYAFEDQIFAGDYDLNDVVLKVSFPVTARNSKGEVTEIDSTKLNVTLVAAGATFEIKAYVGETALFDGKEIHDAFGKYNATAGATQSMINTGNGKAITADPVTDQISIPADWDGDFTKLNVWIWVNPESGKQSETKIYYLTEKKWPYAVMIPNDWAWPTERTCVTTAYAGSADAETFSLDGYDYPLNSFFMWARTENEERTALMNSWYNYPKSGLTMKVGY